MLLVYQYVIVNNREIFCSRASLALMSIDMSIDLRSCTERRVPSTRGSALRNVLARRFYSFLQKHCWLQHILDKIIFHELHHADKQAFDLQPVLYPVGHAPCRAVHCRTLCGS